MLKSSCPAPATDLLPSKGFLVRFQHGDPVAADFAHAEFAVAAQFVHLGMRGNYSHQTWQKINWKIIQLYKWVIFQRTMFNYHVRWQCGVPEPFLGGGTKASDKRHFMALKLRKRYLWPTDCQWMRARDGLDLHSLWPNLPSRLTNQNSWTKPCRFILDKFSYVFIPLYFKKKNFSLYSLYIYIHHPYMAIHIYTLLYKLYNMIYVYHCLSMWRYRMSHSIPLSAKRCLPHRIGRGLGAWWEVLHR